MSKRQQKEKKSPRAPWKRPLVIGLLAWTALWPLAHFFVVDAWDIHPWRLGGFAMYTTHYATLAVPMEAEGGRAPTDGTSRRCRRRPAKPSPSSDGSANALGQLVRPDDVARALFATQREPRHFLVAVQRMRLDSETGRIESRIDQYVYDRTDPP